jgi:molybdopterin-guanine dinucleotide biosynthesis protein A
MTMPDPTILGVLLAGGRSLRMGVPDKALEDLGGRPLLAHAIERLRPQVGSLVISANGDPQRFARFGLPVLPDTMEGYIGPLAGILSGMLWARKHAPEVRLVATAATDTPFFPQDLVVRLLTPVENGKELAVARYDGRDYPTFGLFPVGLANDLHQFLQQSGNLAVMAWIDRHDWAAVDFPPEGGNPFFNINRPEDLALARARLGTEKLHKV